MESSNVEESFPTPPSFLLSEESSRTWQGVRRDQIHSIYSPPPPPPSFSPLPEAATPSRPPNAKFVSYETETLRSPTLTTCPTCETQVTTQVTFQVGTYSWTLCVVFLLCGLILGCCLIPLFVNHFKDAYHSCPLCQQVLHVNKRACCEGTH